MWSRPLRHRAQTTVVSLLVWASNGIEDEEICRSNPDQPSQSLVKAVCYPEAALFTVAATQCGYKHEVQEQVQCEHGLYLCR